MLAALLISIIIFFAAGASAQTPCSKDYTQCAPRGASGREVPIIGPDLARFYLELVCTIRAMPEPENSQPPVALMPRVDPGDALCCAMGSACAMINSFRIAFCWDRFTTGYFLPDGSFGFAANGSYVTPQGDTANLITGEYQMKDGTQGNMYNESPADKPESSDLPLPTPYTSSGVGAAIPASQLGAQLSSTVTASITPTTSSMTTISTPSSSTGSTSRTGDATTSSLTTTTDMSTGGSEATSGVGESSTTSYNGPLYPSLTSETSSSRTETSGTAAPSASGNNSSIPIIPPITNLAAATVVYCMAAKVLVWLVATVLV